MTHSAALVEGLRVAPGAPFFSWLAGHLRESLGVRHAFVAEFVGDDAARVRVLATNSGSSTIDPAFEYDVAGSPLEQAPGAGGIYWYPRAVQRAFPAMRIWESLGIESFAAIRLDDEGGRPLGAVAILHTGPLDDEARVRETLALFRARATGDFELRRAQRARRLLAEATVAARDSNPLPMLAANLARALDVRVAFISEILDAERARSVALVVNGQLVPNVEYRLAGTPCERVYDRGTVVHPRGVRTLYPDDSYLRAWNAEAYVGVALHNRAGRPIGHVGVLHDRPVHAGLATEPVLHVIALLATRELERRRLSRQASGNRGALDPAQLLAGGVAHDFKNLLAGIVAHSGLALTEAALPEGVRGRLEAIQLTAQRAADLACNMLSRFDGETVASEPVDVSALVQETTRLLAPVVPANITITVGAEPGLPCLQGNATHVRQIVMNLLLNAIEAVGARDGSVALRVARRAANGSPPAIVFEVEDTGVGMSEATRARIFEPAFTTKAEGRGIGLAVVRELAVQHAATIAVESTPGRGSRFAVSFPVAPTRPTRAEPASIRALDPSRRLRALVVDDDEGVRLTTSHMLRRLGCDALMAEDGATAVALLERQEGALDLILLDIAMPGLSGEDLVAVVARRWPRLPLVVISGYAAPEVKRRLQDAGAGRFLPKPFGLDALRRCLAEVTTPTARPQAIATA